MIPIMRAFAEPKYKRIVAVMGSQMGKTEAFWNVLGWRLDDDPTPMLYVGPTQKITESMSSDRVMKMLRSVPSLWDKLEKGKKNKIAEKFIGGVRLGFAWAGSATELAGHPVGLVLVDERDRMENSVGGEGDPVELSEARIATYPDGKLAIVSTPTEGTVDVYRHEETGIEHWKVAAEVVSPIWRLWQEGSRHEWAVPCPECGDYFVPRFRHLHWPKDSTPHQALHGAVLGCINCGAAISHDKMHAMNAEGRFLAPGQRVDRNGDVVGMHPATDAASFWVSGLCSPWQTFGQRARDWLRAARSADQDKARTIINTRFGELFAERGDAPEASAVGALRGEYLSDEMPDGSLVVTAGVDVQKDRLVYAVRAWGARSTSWLIRHGEMWGETDRMEVWNDLSELLEMDWSGKRIRLMLVDSGFRPDPVYSFARRHQGRVLPSKGHDGRDKPVSISKLDVTPQGKASRRGIHLAHVDASYFKSFIHGRIAWPTDQPGAWHLPADATDDYCEQITAESRVVKPSGAVVWVRSSKANHYLDCEVLNAAAAHFVQVLRRAPTEPMPEPKAAPQSAAKPPPRVVRGRLTPRWQ